MNSRALQLRILWLSALVALVAGIVFTPYTIRALKALDVRLQTKKTHLAGLRELDASARTQLAFVDALAGLMADGEPVNVASLLAAQLPSQQAGDVRESVSQPLPGWTQRRMEMSFSSVSLRQVAGFLSALEARRPRVRVTSCIVRATAPGQGDVVLTVETLERD